MLRIYLLVHSSIRLAILTLIVAGSIVVSAVAGELTQYFPAVPSGQTPPAKESGWRITWQVLEPGTHNYGGSAILEFQSVEFMKGLKPDGSEDWIKVLNNLALAEMYVPYNDGATEFLDISNFNFRLRPARESYLPKHGVVSAKIEDQYVISEVIDDGVRWLDNRDDFKVQRGQALRLWTMLHAANYTYTLVYTFADDGRISVRAGGTAQNLRDISDVLNSTSVNNATHVHMGAWRMEFDLGDASANRIEVVERELAPGTNTGQIAARPFNGGSEGGVLWNPEKYTIIKVTNTNTLNRHDPPRNISYVIKTKKTGKLKASNPITGNDFWVTRLVPDSESRRVQAPELRYVDLPDNIEAPEPITDKAVVVWHNAGLHHIPRGEDFGATNYRAADGAAINSYAGFDLVPVNLWDKTPFLKR
ncbi:MAG: hypothetical protein ACR2PA_00065 [Hyphomicrobiaceae bacterium]